jgi:hypothetical protein
MARVVSCRPLTVEVRVLAVVSPCEICGGQSGTVTGFFSKFFSFPCHYHSTIAVHTHMLSGGWTLGLLVAVVQRGSLIPST